MRFASLPVLKTAILYGLLAIAHARPAPNNQDVDERSLARRVVTPPLKPVAPHPEPVAPKPLEPVAPGGPDAPANGPDAPGGVKPADPAKPPTTSPEEPPRLGTDPNEKLTSNGNRDLAALETKLKNEPNTGKGFTDYDAKFKDYSVNVQDAQMSMQVGNSARKWFNSNGVNIGKNLFDKGPNGKEVKIYGAPEDVVKAKQLESIWLGKVDAENGVMIRSRQYRSGSFDGKPVSDLYPNIPNEKDRIFMSEHLAKVWQDHGNGKPMTKMAVTDIKNADMEPFLKNIIGSKGNPATIGPNDPEWPTIMGGSVGSPLLRALTDHPDVFHQHKPTGVTVIDDDGLYAIFTLAP